MRLLAGLCQQLGGREMRGHSSHSEDIVEASMGDLRTGRKEMLWLVRTYLDVLSVCICVQSPSSVLWREGWRGDLMSSSRDAWG
eukprot:595884-Prymnesium_polylepis.1